MDQIKVARFYGSQCTVFSACWLQMTHNQTVITLRSGLSAVHTFDDDGMAYFFRSLREEGSRVRRASVAT